MYVTALGPDDVKVCIGEDSNLCQWSGRVKTGAGENRRG